MTAIPDGLREAVSSDEGCRLKLYFDTENIPTIGYGRNLRDRGLSQAEADFMRDNDLVIACEDLDRNAPWWRAMPNPAQVSLANMCLNMGWPRLAGFHDMITALLVSDFETAAAECLDSNMAKQEPARAQRFAAGFRLAGASVSAAQGT